MDGRGKEEDIIILISLPVGLRGGMQPKPDSLAVAGGVRGKMKMDGILWGALRVGRQAS